MTNAHGQAALLPSFQRGDWYQSRDRLRLCDGSDLCLTPELDVVAELMQPAGPVTDWDLPQRAEALNRAAALFAAAPLLIADRAENPSDLADKLAAAHGIPAELTRRWSEDLVGIVRALTGIAPVDKPSSLFVSLPANTFLCLEAVYRGLWTGRRVFLRPSQREPWSALRLVAALIAAGVPRQMVTLVNVPHGGLPRLIRFFDEVVLYGGQAVAGLQHGLPAHVVVRGPGCSVAIVAPGWGSESIAAAARLVARSAGRLCTNVRWLLVSDRAPEFAKALAQRLATASDPAESGLVLEALAARQTYASLQSRLRAEDRLLSPLNPERIARGQRWPAFVAQVARAADHALLQAEPLLPLALVTAGSAEDLADTFAHSAFAYAIDATGTVASLRIDGNDLVRDLVV